MTDSSGAVRAVAAPEPERPAAEPTVLNAGAGPVLVVTAGSALRPPARRSGDELVIGREVSGPREAQATTPSSPAATPALPATPAAS